MRSLALRRAEARCKSCAEMTIGAQSPALLCIMLCARHLNNQRHRDLTDLSELTLLVDAVGGTLDGSFAEVVTCRHNGCASLTCGEWAMTVSNSVNAKMWTLKSLSKYSVSRNAKGGLPGLSI